MKPIAWYDPTNGMVSTDKDSPLFTPLGQVLPLYPQTEQEPVAWRAWVSKFPQGTGSDWVYVTKPIMKDSIHNQPLYTTPPQRTWIGLTDSEISEAIFLMGFPLEFKTENTIVKNIVRNLEAKLKDKNVQR